MTVTRILFGIALIATLACSGASGTQSRPAEATDDVEPSEIEPAGESIDEPDPDVPLPTPFTAEQIRDAFRPGLDLRFYSGAPDGTRVLSRMLVLEADESGVTIEQATLDDAGAVVGEPTVSRSGWAELRDHARFPPGTATRAEVTRMTPLGEYAGWQYTVRKDDATIVQYFFANELPGPPVMMIVRSSDRAMLREYLQVMRTPPSTEAAPRQ